MTIPNDGSYYAEGRTVFKAPLREPREDGGADITIGFPVCTASEWVTKEAPQAIADALNAARSPQPDQSELLREAKTALVGMLTFYGMDEDPNEASGAVHTRARAALLSIAEYLGDEPPETGRQKAKLQEAVGDE